MTVLLRFDCREFLDRVAAYGLGALDKVEREACDQHLALAITHPACLEAADDALRVGAGLAAAIPAPALRPELWTTIEALVRAEMPLSAARPSTVEPLALVATMPAVRLEVVDATPPLEILGAARLRIATPTGCE